MQYVGWTKVTSQHTVATCGRSQRQSGLVVCVEHGWEVQEHFIIMFARSTWRLRRSDVDFVERHFAGLDKLHDTSAFVTQNQCSASFESIELV